MAHRQAQPVTITVPVKLLNAADRIAKEESHTRSELFREALRALIWKRRWEAIQAYGSKKAKAMNLTEKQLDAFIHDVRSK